MVRSHKPLKAPHVTFKDRCNKCVQWFNITNTASNLSTSYFSIDVLFGIVKFCQFCVLSFDISNFVLAFKHDTNANTLHFNWSSSYLATLCLHLLGRRIFTNICLYLYCQSILALFISCASVNCCKITDWLGVMNTSCVICNDNNVD